VTPRVLLLASVGIFIGAMTHIAWDAFTHWDTPVSQYFPGLDAVLFEVHGHTIHVFELLQYLSSVAGLLALAYWGYNLRNEPPARKRRHKSGFLTDRARLLAAFGVVGTPGLASLVTFIATAGDSLGERVFELAINGMIAWAFAWCAVAVIINRLAERARVTSPRR
jgi:hypothetical protein